MEQINFKPNTKKLKVLTPSGYKSFSGITKILTKKKLLRFETETTAIEVTENHKFYCPLSLLFPFSSQASRIP